MGWSQQAIDIYENNRIGANITVNERRMSTPISYIPMLSDDKKTIRVKAERVNIITLAIQDIGMIMLDPNGIYQIANVPQQ